MDVRYVDSVGGNDTDGKSWTNAYATIAQAVSDLTSGDTIYVHTGSTGTHTETISAADEDWDGPLSTTSSGPLKIIGVDNNNPGSCTTNCNYAISSSANVTLTSTYDLNIDGDFAIYGLRIAVSGTGYINIQSDSNEYAYFQDCYIDASSGTPAYFLTNIAIGGESVFINCTLANGADNSYINISGPEMYFIGCTFTGTGSTGNLFNLGNGAEVYLHGCDFSGINASRIVTASSQSTCNIIGTRLAAGQAITISTNNSVNLFETDTDSGNDQYRTEKYVSKSKGTVDVDSSVYRSGGATYDGTNEYSYVINHVTAGITHKPTYTHWNTGFLSSTGSKTFTVYIANATADYDDTEVWLEVEYFGSATTTLKTIATDGETDPTVAIGSGTVQTDDTTSTWVSAKTYMQSLAVTATVNKVGSFRWRVGSRVATDIYVDPKVVVS